SGRPEGLHDDSQSGPPTTVKIDRRENPHIRRRAPRVVAGMNPRVTARRWKGCEWHVTSCLHRGRRKYCKMPRFRRVTAMLAAAVTPQLLLQQQVATLQSRIPAVMDGDVEGVHDARIAT